MKKPVENPGFFSIKPFCLFKKYVSFALLNNYENSVTHLLCKSPGKFKQLSAYRNLFYMNFFEDSKI